MTDRQKERENRRRLTSRIAMAMLALAFVGIVSAGINLYKSSARNTVLAAARQNAVTAVEQAAGNIDYRLQQTADSVRTLLGTVYPYLNSQVDLEGQIHEYNELTRLIQQYVGRSMIEKIRLYVPENKLYSRQGDTFFSLDTLESDESFSAMLSGSRGGVFWQTTHDVMELSMNQTFQAVSCVGVVVDQRNYDRLAGVLFADIPTQDLRQLLSPAGDVRLYIMDGEGTVLAAEAPEETGKASALAGMTLGESGVVDAEGGIFAWKKLKTCGWYLVNTVSQESIYSGHTEKTWLVWMLFAAAGLVAVGLAAVVENTHRATEEWYRNELAISEYQMTALQAQIKPHFLYNTLDVIRWMIADHDVENSVWMVNALSRYLRMSINKGPDVVPLREEIELTRIYIGIMQRRFAGSDGNFSVNYSMEEGTLDVKIPKLSLQPVVENALLHGLQPSEKEEKHLEVRVWAEEDNVIIEVEDNGTGMTQQEIDSLLNAVPGTGAGYGVANVRRRLAIFSDGQCRFSVSSHKGTGTCVTIILKQKT